jgi:peroxiredoxin
MMRFRFILALITLVLGTTYAQTVSITGTDSSYAGVKIELLKYSDQISGSEKELAEAIVKPDGSFTLEFSIDEITYVFAYLGVYKVHLFVEPGRKYTVILPPREDKDLPDLLNPYFSPIVVHLATREFDRNELNTLIRMFNDAYLPYYNKHIMALSEKNDFSELNKNIQMMEKPFSRSKNEYFNDYRRYKYGLLRHLAWQQRSRSISDEYFRDQPVLVNNTSYMELFNKVYDKYLHHFSRTDEGGALALAIRNKSFDSLRNVLASDSVLGEGELPDLVILKCLFDEFYDDNYSRSTLLSILDDYISKADSPKMKEIAVSIRNKVTRLLVGFEPPEFELYDQDSNLVSLEDFRGKYVYLNFCSCFSYTCMNEFKLLAALYEKHGDILEIVTVIFDNDPDVISSFLERSQYQWKFLHYANQSAIIRDYDIRAFPTYYLIDREGKLAISPAPGPGEEFEAHLFKLLRSRGEL